MSDLEKPARDVWADNARAAAAVGVVVIHVASYEVTAASLDADWWMANGFDSLVRWSVPVFFLLSGAFLLTPRTEESATDFYRKRMSRVGLPTLFWTGFYAVLLVVRRFARGHPIDPGETLATVLGGQAHFHLWYLYVIFGIYLFTPLIRRVVAALSPTGGLVVSAVLLLMAGGELVWRGSATITVGPVWVWWLPYLPWFFAGAFVSRLNAERGRSLAWAVAVVGVVATAIGCGVLAEPGDLGLGAYFYMYLSATTVPTSLAVFHLMRGWHSPVMDPPRLDLMARTSLGVYLLHPALLEAVRFAGVRLEDLPSIVAIPVVVVAVFGLSTFGVAMMMRVPGLRRVV